MQPGDEHGNLRLPSIRSPTAGGYTCEVRAESGELARRTVRIEVHSKTILTLTTLVFELSYSYACRTKHSHNAIFL